MGKNIRTEERQLEKVEGRPDYGRVKYRDEEDRVMSLKDVVTVLKRLTFAPSCVDMDWTWDAEEVFVPPPSSQGFRTQTDRQGTLYSVVPGGYRIRSKFQRPERDTGEMAEGFGRWMEIPLEATFSTVVKTAFLCCEIILRHELMESFKYRNARPFDPHYTVGELCSISGARYIDTIP